jgi:hypothetical protein
MIGICVDEAGAPTLPKLAYQSPEFPGYVDAAVDAVARWKFKPFLRHGKPIEACAWLPFVYPSDREPPRPTRLPPAIVRPREDTPEDVPPASQAMSHGHFLPLEAGRLELSLDFGIMNFKPRIAASQQIAASGLEFGGRLALQIFDVLSIGFSFGAAIPSDRSAQDAASDDGGDQPMASVFRYGVDITARTPLLAIGPAENGWVASALFAGVGTARVSGGRGITDCESCRSDSLQLTGGMFWRIGAELTIPRELDRRWGFTVSYQRYLGDASLTCEFLASLAHWW